MSGQRPSSTDRGARIWLRDKDDLAVVDPDHGDDLEVLGRA
jgi:hypothetical protein